MRIKFCGAVGGVTGSCFYIVSGESKFLVDCGLFQGKKEHRKRNEAPFPFIPAELDFVFLTHAHIDHSGLIPRLVKEGFKGKIFATSATIDLVSIMLPDSGHIQEMEAEWSSRKARRAGRKEVAPLYTVDDAYKSLEYFQEADYEEFYTISPTVAVKFYDAGHILGSAAIKLYITENDSLTKIVFSGDLGKSNQPIIRDPSVIQEADIVVMESTYGARCHERKEEVLATFKDIINSTLKKGGNIIIPAFAVGRTQEMLYYLNQLVAKNEIPSPPIYIDSPLAISATEVFTRHPECFDVKMRNILSKGENPFNFPEVTFTPEVKQSRALNEIEGGAVIISASGMCDAGRIKHHLKHNLWRPESTILLVGYQAEGTLGRRLANGEKNVKIFGEEIAVQSQVINVHGFSAHADHEELLDWLKNFNKNLKRVILVHGEEQALDVMRSVIEKEFEIPVSVPSYLEEYTLDSLDKVVDKSTEITYQLKAKEILENWHSFSTTFNQGIERFMQSKDLDAEDLEWLEEKLQEISSVMKEKVALKGGK